MKRERTLHTHKTDICFKLLWLAVFFAPLRGYGFFTIGPYIGTAFKILSLFTIILTFLNILMKKYKIGNNAVFIGMLFLLGYDLFTLAYSESVGLFPTYFIAHLIILFGYIVAINNQVHIRKLVWAYLFSSIFPILIGLYQWVGVTRTGIVPPLPFQEFLIVAGKDELFLYGNYRVVSTLQDPSFYGLFMSSIVAISIVLLIYDKEKRSSIFRYSLISFILLGILCIFSSGSVSSMVNVVSCVFFILLTGGGNLKKVLPGIIMGLSLIFISVYIMSAIFNYNPIDVLQEKLIIQGDENTTFGRQSFFNVGIEAFLKSPIIGVGFGGMELFSAHNSYLTFLGYQGILGLLAHLNIIVRIPFMRFKKITRNKKNKLNAYYIALATALFGMCIQVFAYDCIYLMDVTSVLIMLNLVFVTTANRFSNMKKVHNV